MQIRMACLRVATALIFAATGALSLSAQTAASETIELELKSHPKWKWDLPAETWNAVGTTIPIAHQNGEGFPVRREGTKLQIDSALTGGSGTEIAGIGGTAVLRGDDAEGQPFAYVVRVRKSGEAFEWATGGSMQGKFKGQAIQLFDQNGNGRYDDFGVDAMVVGRGVAASFLSKVVSIKGALYTIEVAADGRSMSFAAYEGEAGTLDLKSGFRANGSLDSVVVRSANGEWSFELSDEKKGLLVPAGEYSIAAGRVSAGSEKAKIRAGSMKPLAVAKDQTARLEWGAEMRLDFEFTAGGGQVKVDPNTMRYVGSAGEEYFDWIPNAVSPKILIANAKTGRPLGEGRFGGC